MGNEGGGYHTTTSAYETTTTAYQHPTTTDQHPTTTYQHPTTTYQHPTTTQKETTTEHPTTTIAKTTTTYSQPTTTHEDTTTTHPHHDTTTTVPRTTTTHKPTTTTGGGTTTTTSHGTTTTAASTTTSSSIPPMGDLFSVDVFAFCGSDNLPEISITFGNRPDLNGQTGVLSFSTGGSVFLVFQSNQTVTIPYPNTTQNVNLIYSLGPETQTASVTFPENCPPGTTTTTAATTTTTAATTTTAGATTTTTTSTTLPGGTTTTVTPTTPPATPPTTTTLPETFTFGAAATVCVAEVPTIRITFQNQFPSLAGRTGTLTLSDVNGNVVGSQPLVYQPGATVDILYPGRA